MGRISPQEEKERRQYEKLKIKFEPRTVEEIFGK